ncbi:hypothetical protein C2G38_1993704, partial [Gigaspora rosea]
MTKADGSSDFVITLTLKPNATYSYKFVVDGNWVLDHNVPSHPDSGGNFNHVELKNDNNNDNEKVESYDELKNSTDNDNEKTEKCDDELKNGTDYDNENDNEKVERYDDESKNSNEHDDELKDGNENDNEKVEKYDDELKNSTENTENDTEKI